MRRREGNLYQSQARGIGVGETEKEADFSATEALGSRGDCLRKWRVEHRDQVNDYSRKWKAEHRDRVKIYNKKWFEKRIALAAPEEKFDETDAIFQVLVECYDQMKVYATDDGKPLLPLLWKCARELTQ